MTKALLKTVQIIDRDLADMAFTSGKSEADLADALIAAAEEWDDNPNEKTKTRQEALTLSIKIGRVASAFYKEGKVTLPRGVDWIQYAIAQWDAKPAKRHADFVRHRNASANYVSYLLKVTYLPSAAKTGRKRGTKAPKAKTPKAKTFAPKIINIKEDRPLYDLARLPVFKPEDAADKAENWTRAALVLVEDAAATNEGQFNASKKLAEALSLIHKALAILKN